MLRCTLACPGGRSCLVEKGMCADCVHMHMRGTRHRTAPACTAGCLPQPLPAAESKSCNHSRQFPIPSGQAGDPRIIVSAHAALGWRSMHHCETSACLKMQLSSRQQHQSCPLSAHSQLLFTGSLVVQGLPQQHSRSSVAASRGVTAGPPVSRPASSHWRRPKQLFGERARCSRCAFGRLSHV